jgi:WXG100 family type VII secretion target
MDCQSSTGGVRRLDTAYFTSTLAMLKKAIDTMDGALSNIQTQTNTLQDNWEGKGAKKFNSAYKRLKKEFDDQEEVLTAIREDLLVVLQTYVAWDESAKNVIAGGSSE